LGHKKTGHLAAGKFSSQKFATPRQPFHKREYMHRPP
jgi:hypothetical protein